ncbi:MAG: ferredoxin [Nanopusillaceae archaeon]
MKKIFYKILQELCINCGACIIISPESFTIDKDKKITETKKYSDNIKEIEKIYLAKKVCPTEAIIVEEV